MTDPRFDGSLDAPPAIGSLCVESGCGQGADHFSHSEANPQAHFFRGNGDPLLSPRTPEPPTLRPAVERKATRGTSPSSQAPRDSEGQPEPRTMVRFDPEPVRQTAQRRETDAKRSGDTRTCIVCGGQRRSHRGRKDHKFTPPAAETSAPEFVNPTLGQITDAFARQVPEMAIAPRIQIRNLQVKPLYAPGSDTELLSAHVLLDVALIFLRQENR